MVDDLAGVVRVSQFSRYSVDHFSAEGAKILVSLLLWLKLSIVTYVEGI